MSDAVVLGPNGRPLREQRAVTADSFPFDPAPTTTSGVRVTNTSALAHSAVWRAIVLIAGAIAKTPRPLYQINADGGKSKWKQHPTYRLLNRRPNAEMTAFTFFQSVMFHVLSSWGNAYAWIERVPVTNSPRELVLLSPEWIHPVRVDGQIVYSLQIHARDLPESMLQSLPPDQRASGVLTRVLNAQNVLHFKSLSWDGVHGIGPIQAHRETIGRGLAMREQGSRFYKNAARGGMILEYPGSMPEADQKNFLAAWNNNYAGLQNQHKTIILEGGLKVSTPMHFNAVDAQYVETLGTDIREVSNIFGVRPHKLGDTTRTSFASLEQENQSDLDDVFDPHMVAIEQELNEKLVTEENLRTDAAVIEFNREALVRADMKAKTESVNKLTGGPVMTPNEGRAVFNLAPIEGGDELQTPLNMVAVGPPGEQEPVLPEPEEDEERANALNAVQAVVDDAIARSTIRIRGKLDRGQPIQEKDEQIIDHVLTPAVNAYCALTRAVPAEALQRFRTEVHTNARN